MSSQPFSTPRAAKPPRNPSPANPLPSAEVSTLATTSFPPCIDDLRRCSSVEIVPPPPPPHPHPPLPRVPPLPVTHPTHARHPPLSLVGPLACSLARAPSLAHSLTHSLARFHSPTPGRFIRRETFYVVYIKGNVSTAFPLKQILSN